MTNAVVSNQDQSAIVRTDHIARIQVTDTVRCDHLIVGATGKHFTTELSIEASAQNLHDAALSGGGTRDHLRRRNRYVGVTEQDQAWFRSIHIRIKSRWFCILSLFWYVVAGFSPRSTC